VLEKNRQGVRDMRLSNMDDVPADESRRHLCHTSIVPERSMTACSRVRGGRADVVGRIRILRRHFQANAPTLILATPFRDDLRLVSFVLLLFLICCIAPSI
jgi:hypothetical protein